MPTRLQDGLSIALIQWVHSVEASASREVIVRIADSESLAHILYNLENAGLNHVEQLTSASVKGRVVASDLTKVARCHGVCSVVQANDIHDVSNYS